MTVPQVVLTRDADTIVISSPSYRLEFRRVGVGFDRSPVAHLSDASGTAWLSINLLSSLHSTTRADETLTVADPEFTQRGNDILVTIASTGSAWTHKVTTLLCGPDRLEYRVSIEGTGRIDDVTLFGGDGVLPGGAAGTFRSAIRFAAVFSPTPSEPIQVVRPAASSVALGVVGDAEPGRLNAVFSPPPLVLGFGREVPAAATSVPDGDWLGLSVIEPIERLTFSTLRYEPVDGGFLVRLDYDGHTAVDGEWASPTIILRPATSGWGLLEDYRDELVEHGFAAVAREDGPAWWREPLFCGWGAQCARHAAVSANDRPKAGEATDVPVAGALMGAPDYARQVVYDELLATIRSAGITPGTIVLDDRWQAQYGTAQPDIEHWPDLKAWIADRHAEGVRVLLWWKAWDPGGIPADECVRDAAGRPVAVDPANPAYVVHLAEIVHSLLGPDGLDADGFKVDFTQRAPTGRTLDAHPGPWGIAALHALLDALYTAAKVAKPDACVITHTVHPSFGDVTDVVRLNDVLERDVHGQPVPVVDQLRFRHAVASRALPGHPIDTDQWPMPSRREWLNYSREQVKLGIPALYYAESIDATGEPIEPDDLAEIATTWAGYRARITA